MNYYSFIPLAAFTINAFTWTYIFAQKRKVPVNRAYLAFSGFLAGWSISAFVCWLPIPETFLVPILKISSITWIATGFCFLNFSYAFLEMNRGKIYYAFLSLTILSILISVSTNLFIDGYVKYYWGVSQKPGILFNPIALISMVSPYLYALFLMYKKKLITQDKNIQKKLNLILQGCGFLIAYGLFSDVILPQIFGVSYFLRIATMGTVIQSLFIFRAVTKYNFLAIGVEEAANYLFTSIEDGIALIDNNEHIIQMNDTFKKLFHVQIDKSLNIKASDMIDKYKFSENYKNYETKTINMKNEQKNISISQATVQQKSVELGKILIIRDITESKKAEKELHESKKKLEDLAGKLRQANTSLEHKVAERTRSLLNSNEQLQREINERTRAEENLAAEKERLAVTLSSIGDGVITTDTLGNIVLLNTVAVQLTGWSQANAIGTSLLDVFRIVDAKTRRPRPNPVTEVLQTNGIIKRSQPSLLIARDGTEHLIAKTMAPIRDQEGRVIGVVLVFSDTTERQRLEEEIIKTERLESIGVLAGGIAHDFNNILTAILGNVSLAKMYASEDAKTTTRLVNAEKAALRAQDLTQQLLTFSKGGTPVKQLSSIKELIQEAVDFSLRGSNVRCDLDLPVALWPADIDAGQISQVIHNLMINADQAMPDGGVIEVSAENVTVDDGTPEYLLMLKQGKYVKISIKDQGVGIEEERLQKIFDPYFTTKQQGNGLGLFTSYSIIKKHDGYIDVKSKVGSGTTFHIYLPALQKAIVPTYQDEDATLSGKGKILVMEDEEDLREVMGSMLGHFGYDVAFASHGTEAIHVFQRARAAAQPFDVIILDLTIPGGMGAKETITQLLALDPHAKAIVASGYANDPIMGEFKQYGFCGCIAKPYKGNELHRILHDVIAGSNAAAVPAPARQPY